MRVRLSIAACTLHSFQNLFSELAHIIGNDLHMARIECAPILIDSSALSVPVDQLEKEKWPARGFKSLNYGPRVLFETIQSVKT